MQRHTGLAVAQKKRSLGCRRPYNKRNHTKRRASGVKSVFGLLFHDAIGVLHTRCSPPPPARRRCSRQLATGFGAALPHREPLTSEPQTRIEAGHLLGRPI
jgi:hypothetical protein